MNFFKTKKFKIICIVFIIIFILYLILFSFRFDISKGTITNIRNNYIRVIIDGKPHWLIVDNTLILNENNTKISLSTLKVDDNIFILNYNWEGWVYHPVGFIPAGLDLPAIDNVWLIKVID